MGDQCFFDAAAVFRFLFCGKRTEWNQCTVPICRCDGDGVNDHSPEAEGAVAPYLWWFFALSVLGFVLSYLSLRIPFLRYPSLVLLGFIVVLAVLWTFFAAVSFGIYPTRFIGAIGAGMGLTLALFHSSLQELLRDNIALLYGIYAALSVVLLIVYFFWNPTLSTPGTKKTHRKTRPLFHSRIGRKFR